MYLTHHEAEKKNHSRWVSRIEGKADSEWMGKKKDNLWQFDLKNLNKNIKRLLAVGVGALVVKSG